MRTLAVSGVAVLEGLSPAAEVFRSVAVRFGEPLASYSAVRAGRTEFVGDVRLRADLHEDERLPTQGCAAIGPHTARAYSAHRPRLFASLMVNAGWETAPEGSGGETMVVAWSDVITAHRQRWPSRAEADLVTLRSTPVSYRPWYVEEPVADEPILFETQDGHDGARYWENMVETTQAHAKIAGDRQNYLAALARFDDTLGAVAAAAAFRRPSGHFMVIDNRRFAHGRLAFLPSRSDDQGRTVTNPRRVLTAHLL